MQCIAKNLNVGVAKSFEILVREFLQGTERPLSNLDESFDQRTFRFAQTAVHRQEERSLAHFVRSVPLSYLCVSENRLINGK